MVCDICGGKLVMRTGGIAFCDSCGMEYSLEAMREKIQVIQGVVQIDNSNMVASWMNMANSAAEAGNHKEAYEYYTKVLEVEPLNWRAIFGKGKAGAWQSTLANSRTAELYQAVKKAIALIDEADMPLEEIIQAKNEFAMSIFYVNNAFLECKLESFGKRKDKFYDMHYDEWWDVYQYSAVENIKKTEDAMSIIIDLDGELTRKNLLEMKKHICSILVLICDCSTTYWENYKKDKQKCFGLQESSKKQYIDRYIELVSEIRESEPDYRRTMYLQIDPWSPPTTSFYFYFDLKREEKIHTYWEEWEKQQKEHEEKKEAEERYSEYWKVHTEEKEQLTERKNDILAEIDDLKAQCSQYDDKISAAVKETNRPVPADSEIVNLRAQHRELRAKKEQLGIFSIKEKKEFQNMMEILETQIADAEWRKKQQKINIQNDVTARISLMEFDKDLIKRRLNELENELMQIDEELTKER